MYIKITPNIVNEAIAGNQMAVRLLDDMNVACRSGKHFFWGDLDTLQLIRKNYGIQYPYLARLCNTYATQGAIATTMLWHVEFSFADEKSYVKELEGRYTIHISLNDIYTFQVTNECHVVVENLEDTKIYQYVLDYFKRVNHLTQTHNTYYPVLGGGSTTAMVLEHEITQRQSLVFCIVDSDMTYSTDNLKETASKVNEVYSNQQEKFHVCLYLLDKVMEVENLIPISVYDVYCNEKDLKNERGVVRKNLEVLKKILKIKETYLDFFDMKSGIHSSHLIDESERNTNREIVECISNELFCSIHPHLEKYRIVVDILRNAELGLSPQKIENLADKCVAQDAYVQGLGKNILKNVLKECDRELSTIEITQLTSTQQKIYMEIGELLYNWTLSGEVMRI